MAKGCSTQFLRSGLWAPPQPCAPHRAPGPQGAPGASGCAHSAGKRDPAEPRPCEGHQAWSCCVAQLEGEAQDLGWSPSQLQKGLLTRALSPPLPLGSFPGERPCCTCSVLHGPVQDPGCPWRPGSPVGRGPAGWLAQRRARGPPVGPGLRVQSETILRAGSRPRQQRAAPETARARSGTDAPPQTQQCTPSPFLSHSSRADGGSHPWAPSCPGPASRAEKGS